MVNRVLLNADGLKVSVAGQDVLTATEANLLFNSDYAQPSVWMRGSFSIGDDTTRTVNFGKTFNPRPWVTFLANISGDASDDPMAFENDNANWGISTLRYWCNVGSSSFTFRAVTSGADVQYIVWDINL